MDQPKIKVNKITTTGNEVFYTREQDRGKLWTLPGVQRIEDAEMTEEEYNAIPATDASKSFFAGQANVSRSE